MKVIVDYERCEGNARCVKEAPTVFRTDENDQLHLLQPEPPEELRAAVEAAVARCPRQALMIDD
ncbi:MAG: ferredoxin [Deltaproteobacteria bacterium]|nr:ferredoxin [Kofleriaceae bacterium]